MAGAIPFRDQLIAASLKRYDGSTLGHGLRLSAINCLVRQRVTKTGYSSILPSRYLARRRAWISSIRR